MKYFDKTAQQIVTDEYEFKGDLFPPASVGEATSLPCGSTLQNGADFGEFV